MKAAFSIRYKFLTVTTLLLVLCVAVYLYLATKLFKSDKTELVFDYNRSLVGNVASDIDSLFRGLSDKMKLVAFLFHEKESRTRHVIDDLMKSGDDIVFMLGSQNFKEIERQFFLDPAYLETYGLSSEAFIRDLTSRIPFDRLLAEGEVIWSTQLEKGPPLIGFAKSVIEEDAQGKAVAQFAVVSYIRPDKIIKSLMQSRLNDVFIASATGAILVHPQGENSQKEKIVELALNQKLKTSVLQFEEAGQQMLGAYSKTFQNKIVVLSKVSEDKAFAVVNRLVYRSLLFASIVLTLAFIAAILFSRSLTKPIEILMGGMKRVSEGDLTTQITVPSRDEISVLAKSFNLMINDLKDSRRELEEINSDLENKVKERTQELEKQHRAVKEAQEALIKSSRLAAIGEIAGQAAHEVLNPLTSILSRVQKVRERLENQRLAETQLLRGICEGWQSDYSQGGFDQLIQVWKQKSQVKPELSIWDEDLENLREIDSHLEQEFHQLLVDTDFLLQEGQRINKIVNSMRSYNTVKNQIKLHSIHKILEKAQSIMADMAAQSQIGIHLVNEAERDQVSIDEDEFLQVMTNLLRNSIQSITERQKQEANLQGEIVITTSLINEELQIVIADNGMGLNEENAKHLFKRQFSTKSKAEGTGLGLKISRRFIRAFHGDICLERSAPLEGAAFKITLPLAEGEERVSA